VNVDARAEAWARLQAAGIPQRSLVALLRAFGSPDAVLAATTARRRGVVAPEINTLLEAAIDSTRLEATLAWLRVEGHDLIAWGDADYPPPLLEIGDPPAVFFCIGRRELLRHVGLVVKYPRDG
jgi:DNA processing protein